MASYSTRVQVPRTYYLPLIGVKIETNGMNLPARKSKGNCRLFPSLGLTGGALDLFECHFRFTGPREYGGDIEARSAYLRKAFGTVSG